MTTRHIDMRTPSRSPFRAVLVTSAFSVALLAACGESDSSPNADDPATAPESDAPAPVGAQTCPRVLPEPAEGSTAHDEPAPSRPSLETPEKAWVCQYTPNDAGPGPDGAGTTWGWVRKGAPRLVAAGRLTALAEHLSALQPSPADAICTMDLGPRWMLVFSHGSDLTGVVVDDFGCHDVRLTDDPASVAPGESTADGIVPGTLQAPAGLLPAITRAGHTHAN